MKILTPKQKRKLRALAHELDPVILIGHQGLTDAVIKSIAVYIEANELVKVKFNKFKEEKDDFCQVIEQKAQCFLAGRVGNVGIFYKQHVDPKKRKIVLE